MQVLMLVCAGSNFTPPDTIQSDTEAPGPRTATDEQVVGFDLLEVESLDAAVDLARSHPMARAGHIELRALWDGTPSTTRKGTT